MPEYWGRMMIWGIVCCEGEVWATVAVLGTASMGADMMGASWAVAGAGLLFACAGLVGVMARISCTKSSILGSTIGAGVGTGDELGSRLVSSEGVEVLVLPRLKLNLSGSTRVMAWFTNERNIASEIPCITRREKIMCRGLVSRPSMVSE